MIRHVLVATVLAALIAPAADAQPVLYQQHTVWGTPPNDLLSDISGYTRFSLNSETFIAYFPAEDCNGWGHHPANSNPASPNFDTYRIEGIMFAYADLDASTPHGITLSISAEDPTNPGVPPVQSVASFNLQISGGGTGQQAFYLSVGLPDVFVPRTGGVFISIAVPSGTNSDILLIGNLRTTDPMTTVTEWDVPNGRTALIGHGLGTNGGFGFLVDSTGAGFYADRAWVICPLGQQTLFTVAATTNQTSMPDSNPGATPGFTTSPFSARNPALLTDRGGNTRSDDLAFILENQSFNGSELVGVLMAPLGLGAAPVDLTVLDPNWQGFVCLDLTIPPLELAIGAPTGGRFVLNAPIPTADRPGLLGLEFGWWGVALDFVGGRVLAGPCLTTAF